MTLRPTRDLDIAPDGAVAGLRVLASGSSGNCSVLVVPGEGTRRVILIDAGLSPRRTLRHLAEFGIEPWEIDDIVLTHLDQDHAHPGWRKRDGMRATLRMHKRHMGRAERSGMLNDRCEPFGDDGFELGTQLRAETVMMSHDSLGVAAFRFRVQTPCRARRADIGFATDLGRVTPALIDHLRGVDVLAIESNYCPQMQADADRPEFLKRRVTGGSGHLSNQEAARAIEAIRPRDQVVFLHLSRECNDPGRVSEMHVGGDVGFTISTHDEPTRWIWAQGQDHSQDQSQDHVPNQTPESAASKPGEKPETLFDMSAG